MATAQKWEKTSKKAFFVLKSKMYCGAFFFLEGFLRTNKRAHLLESRGEGVGKLLNNTKYKICNRKIRNTDVGSLRGPPW